MKNLILLFMFICISLLGFSQVVVDTIRNDIYLDNVHEIDLTKKELKEKANRWIAKTYNNSNYVTRINNDDNILIKGSFKVGADFTSFGVTVYSPRNVDYTMDIKFKEGRYKIDIVDLNFSAENIIQDVGFYLMTKKEYRDYSINYIDSYGGSHKKSMLKRINNDEKFDKDYKSQSDYGDKIIQQIIEKLRNIDAELRAYMQTKSDSEDW